MAFDKQEYTLLYETSGLKMVPNRITINLDGIEEYELVLNNGKRLEFNLDRFLELGLIREIKEEK